MSAPQYLPHGLADRPRRGEALPPAARWTATRPADLTGRQPAGSTLGFQGPDQGYVLTLLPYMRDRLQLGAGEDLHDVEAGAVAVALKRASLYGRAPIIHDLEVAYRLWGYLDPAPAELGELRRQHFSGASHDYVQRRRIADAVPADVLRFTPAVIAERHATDWRSLLDV